MKLRNGFVSNSSSSSFLIVGVDQSKLTDEQIKLMEDNGFKECCELGYEDDESGNILGKEWYIGEYKTESFSSNAITDVVDNIQSVLGKKADIRVIVGSRYS